MQICTKKLPRLQTLNYRHLAPSFKLRFRRPPLLPCAYTFEGRTDGVEDRLAKGDGGVSTTTLLLADRDIEIDVEINLEWRDSRYLQHLHRRIHKPLVAILFLVG